MQAAAGSSFAQPPAPDAPDADPEERAFQTAALNLSDEEWKSCLLTAIGIVKLMPVIEDIDISTPAGHAEAKRRIIDVTASKTRKPRIAKQAARKPAGRPQTRSAVSKAKGSDV